MNTLSPISPSNNCRLGRPEYKSTKKSRKIIKSKLLSTSLCVHRDFPVFKDTLPILIIQEQKPVIQRPQLVKTRTLPFIKQNEPDSAAKPENSTIPISNNLTAIHMKKKSYGSDIKIRLQKLIQKERPNQPMDSVTIQLSLCEDLKPRRELGHGISSNILCPPILSPRRSSHSSKRKQRSGSPIFTRSTSICETKDGSDDPYYYLNILKYINFSSFYLILEGTIDPLSNSFPYYARIFKTNIKLKSVQKKIIERSPKGDIECMCVKKEEMNSMYDKKAKALPGISQLRKIVPNLVCSSLTPQSVQYPKHVIILNFEGALGSYAKDLCIKPGILRIIKKYSAFFQIILVLETNPKKTSEILKLFEELEINLSGVYKRREVITGKELSKIQDYTEIYQSFHVTNPEREVLVIAQHKYIDENGSDYQKLISMHVGISTKLNVDRAPVGCEEYPNCPCTILMPNFHIKQNVHLLKKLSRLAEFFKEMEIPEATLDFKNVLEKFKFQTVRSTEVFQVVFDHCYSNPGGIHKFLSQNRQRPKKNCIYCCLHDKFSLPSSRVPLQSVFVIN